VADCQVSIIIVTHNSRPALDSCLEALSDAAGDLDYELVVVDNHSDNDPTEIATRHFPNARMLLQAENRGFGAACNEGAAIASGRHLMFLNPDVIPDRGSLEQLDQILSRGVRLGAVGGRLRFPDGTFQPSCRHFPTVGNLLFSRGSILGRLLGRSERYTLPDFEELTEVPAVAGTMMMLRADLFRRLDGFDRRFFMYMEDTDLCFRLDRRGFSNVFAPGAGGVHAWTSGSDASRISRACWHHSSLWRYFLKHVPNFFSLLILPVLLMLHLGLVIVFGRRPDQEAKHGK
jgi:hypothetical protein